MLVHAGAYRTPIASLLSSVAVRQFDTKTELLKYKYGQ